MSSDESNNGRKRKFKTTGLDDDDDEAKAAAAELERKRELSRRSSRKLRDRERTNFESNQEKQKTLMALNGTLKKDNAALRARIELVKGIIENRGVGAAASANLGPGGLVPAVARLNSSLPPASSVPPAPRANDLSPQRTLQPPAARAPTNTDALNPQASLPVRLSNSGRSSQPDPASSSSFLSQSEISRLLATASGQRRVPMSNPLGTMTSRMEDTLMLLAARNQQSLPGNRTASLNPHHQTMTGLNSRTNPLATSAELRLQQARTRLSSLLADGGGAGALAGVSQTPSAAGLGQATPAHSDLYFSSLFSNALAHQSQARQTSALGNRYAPTSGLGRVGDSTTTITHALFSGLSASSANNGTTSGRQEHSSQRATSNSFTSALAELLWRDQQRR